MLVSFLFIESWLLCICGAGKWQPAKKQSAVFSGFRCNSRLAKASQNKIFVDNDDICG